MNEVKFKANIKDLNAVQTAVEAIPTIPEPTVANEGKVLTVTVDSSGETPVAGYELETPSGGSMLIVTGEPDEEDEYEILDKTYSEIATALTSGVPCFIKHEGAASTVPILGALQIGSDYTIITLVTYGQSGAQYLTYTTDTPDGYPMSEAD